MLNKCKKKDEVPENSSMQYVVKLLKWVNSYAAQSAPAVLVA